MNSIPVDKEIIRNAWEGRVSGCILGKPVEVLAMQAGRETLTAYLKENDSLPLRDYVPLGNHPVVEFVGKNSCKGHISRSEPDDDINYTVLALIMLEKYGLDLTTHAVASTWLRFLPVAMIFTAERAAYRKLMDLTDEQVIMVDIFPHVDLSECANHEWSEWIGAQIRADMYGWVCPGNPSLAADLAGRDASLSHTGDGIYGAQFIAALAAAIPASDSVDKAIDAALAKIPKNSGAAEAIAFAREMVGKTDAVDQMHERYKDLSPVHTINNLALVVWAILAYEDDFSEAIGEVVAAGWDTDCNGATVGGLWGLTGKPIPEKWTSPWCGKVAVHLAGVGELSVDDLVDRTVTLSQRLAEATQ